jgi:hypothetical protein
MESRTSAGSSPSPTYSDVPVRSFPSQVNEVSLAIHNSDVLEFSCSWP